MELPGVSLRIALISLCHPDRSVRLVFPPRLLRQADRGPRQAPLLRLVGWGTGSGGTCCQQPGMHSASAQSLSSLKGLAPFFRTNPGLRYAPSWANGGATPPAFGSTSV